MSGQARARQPFCVPSDAVSPYVYTAAGLTRKLGLAPFSTYLPSQTYFCSPGSWAAEPCFLPCYHVFFRCPFKMQLDSALPSSIPSAPCSSFRVINVVKGLPRSLYCSRGCVAPTADRMRFAPGAAHARTCWRGPSGCLHRGMGAEELAHSSVYPVFIGESLLGERGTAHVDIQDVLLVGPP